ncbi:MAG TPA: type III PLP-dependent enzyme [Candidatus Saccharimonadales bacterium]|nr:type III PLP-dependent enzyme [Candidatus Saccharimonadales bacterium]
MSYNSNLNTQTPTPFMLTDLGVIRNHCRTFKRLMPKIELSYAMKAYPDDQVLRVVGEEVSGFDAASIGEIDKLLNIGVDPARIAFNNPVKSQQNIDEAVQKGVVKFTFQSRQELDKLAKSGKKLEVFARVKMDDSHSVVPLSTKFGCAPEDVTELLQYAERLGLAAKGIAFHVGSQQTGLNEWTSAIKNGIQIIRNAQKSGVKADMINVGGGFPAQYHKGDTTFKQVAEQVNAAIADADDIKFIAEPGRYLAAESSMIITSVIGKEERGGKTWLFLDTGIFQAFAGALRFKPFPYPPYCQDKTSESTKDYVLTGPTCDSQDVFPEEMTLPDNVGVGDKICFPNSGAYTVVYGSDFNGFSVPKRVFIDSER